MTKQKNLTEQEREAYALVGRHGGRAIFKQKGRKYMQTLGKLGAQKRWGKRSENNKNK